MKQKYYAVKKGFKVGVYLSWDECKKQVEGFKGAVYKSFPTFEEANEFVQNGELSTSKKEKKECGEEQFVSMKKDKLYAFVDGSYNIATDTVGYGVVLVKNNEVKFKDLGSFRGINFNESKNVFGEIRGALKAVEICIANEFDEVNIVHDYNGISKFATGEWKAKVNVTKDYQMAMFRYKKLIKINFIKVKAHTGNEFNEMADKLAKKASVL